MSSMAEMISNLVFYVLLCYVWLEEHGVWWEV